jgi:hypothetical protein
VIGVEHIRFGGHIRLGFVFFFVFFWYLESSFRAAVHTQDTQAILKRSVIETLRGTDWGCTNGVEVEEHRLGLVKTKPLMS